MMQGMKTRKISVDFHVLKRVVSYLEPEEKRHYEEYEIRPRNHIWLYVKKLKKAIKDSTQKYEIK